MKTYFVQLEEDEEETEVIPTSLAFTYSLFQDLKALIDEDINEEEFCNFLDQECYQIEDKLKEAWESWKEEN